MAPDPNGFLFEWGDDLKKMDTINWEPNSLNKLAGMYNVVFDSAGCLQKTIKNEDGTYTNLLANGLRFNQHDWDIPGKFEIHGVEKRDAGSRIAGVPDELAFCVEYSVTNDNKNSCVRTGHWIVAQRMRNWPKAQVEQVSKFVDSECEDSIKVAWKHLLVVFMGKQMELKELEVK